MKRFFVLCLTVVVAIASFVLVGCSTKDDGAASNIVYYFSKDGGETIAANDDGTYKVVKTIKKGETVEGVTDQDLNEYGSETRGYTVVGYKVINAVKDATTVYVRVDIEVKRFSIKYDYNGGEIDPNAKSNPKGTYKLTDSIDLLKTAPAVRAGYEHIGWSENPNATSVNECIMNTNELVDNPRNLVLYAIYVPAE